jgi:iron complex transport system substrate-binding protein
MESGLGLTAPDGYTNDTEGAMSLEGLSELNPDHIFYMSDTAGDYKAVYDELQASSVWTSLNAVKNGNVYPIDHGIDTVFEALNK